MADVKFILDADTAKAVKGILKVMDANKKTEKSFGKATRAGKQASKAFNGVGRELRSMALGVVGVTAIVGGLTAAFRKMTDERKLAAQGIKEGVFGLGSLAQLAGGDIGRFTKLMDKAREISKRGGVSESIASQVQFSLTSLGVGEGKGGIRNEIIGLIRSGTINPEEAADVVRSVGVLQTAFGKEEAGSPKQILAKLLRGSSKSQVSFTEFSPSATITAQEAKKIGATDEETLALLSVLGNALKSPDVAATAMASLTATIRKKGLGGKGFIGAISSIQAALKGKEEAEVIKFFGRKEAERAFSGIVSNLPAIREEIEEQKRVDIAAGTRGGLVERTVSLFKQDPQLLAASRFRGAEAEEKLFLQNKVGIRELDRQRTLKEVNVELAKRGIGPFRRQVKTGVTGFLSEAFNLSPETTSSIGLSGTTQQDSGEEKGVVPGSMIVEALQKIEGNTRTQSGAARSAHTE